MKDNVILTSKGSVLMALLFITRIHINVRVDVKTLWKIPLALAIPIA
jgi:hypothetical protein